jgi:hypothetical protein
MVNRIITSLVFIVLGLLMAILPHTLFHVCTGTISSVSGIRIPMKCFWTARMATGLGVLFCVSGILLYFSKGVLARVGISLMIFMNGILLAAVPTVLIGVCKAETMPCRMGTLPCLLVLAVLILTFSLANLFYLYRQSVRGTKP